MKSTYTLIGCALLAASSYAQAPSPKASKTLVFLKAAQIDPSRLLPPPPRDGSEVQQKEMAAVRHLIETRSPERYKQAVWDAEHEDATPFAAVIGESFDLAKLPATRVY